MFCFYFKKLPQIKNQDFNYVCFLRNPSFEYLFPSVSTTSTNNQKPSFTTVDYLKNECGLSPEQALFAAKQVHLKTRKNPDSVLTFLRNHGFTNSHIRGLISTSPAFLRARVEENLGPKFRFFLDMGFPASDLREVIISNPCHFQRRSLKNRIIPSIDMLRSFLHANENVIAAIKRSGWFLSNDLHKTIVPKISILQNLGVPKSNISKLLIVHPRIFFQKLDRFNGGVSLINELGIKPESAKFILAFRVACSMRSSKWNAKLEVFRSLGLSEDAILDVFKRQPKFLTCSEEKIRRGLDFLVNKLNYKPSDIYANPVLLMYSLEKRVIPRVAVLWILTSNGMLKKSPYLSSFFTLSNAKFLDKYVIKYKEKVPELLEVYKEVEAHKKLCKDSKGHIEGWEDDYCTTDCQYEYGSEAHGSCDKDHICHCTHPC